MSVMDALYANKASLVAIFNIIDADNSGKQEDDFTIPNLINYICVISRRNYPR